MSHTCPKLVFQVGPSEFELGRSQRSDACPVAIGFKNKYPHFRGISVDLATVRATDPEKNLRYVWLTPPSAQAIITLADPDLAAANGTPNIKSIKSIWVTLTPAGSQVVPVRKRAKRIREMRLAKARAAIKAAKKNKSVKAVKAAKTAKTLLEAAAETKAFNRITKSLKKSRIILSTANSGNPRIVGGKEPPMHAQHTVTRRSGARRLANFDFSRLIDQ